MGKRILCIEDESQMIDLIRLILEDEGYDVIGAEGGQEGLAQMRAEKPDLILLDLMMPEMDGGDVFRQMKEEVELRDIPVIVVNHPTAELPGIKAMVPYIEEHFPGVPVEYLPCGFPYKILT